MSRLNEAKTALEQYEQTKPGAYQSQYKPKIDNVLGKLEDMGEFDYDPDADTAYKQYKDQYTRQAQKDNENAQASAAALTGGYANSYGTQAGQTAYASTMDRLDSVLDGLYNQSLGEYNAKKNGLQSQLSSLQQAENSAYNTYQQKKANGIQTATGIGQMIATAAPWIIKAIMMLL